MRFITNNFRWVGSRGGINQDSIAISHALIGKKNLFMAAVADGVGGLTMSEEASGYVLYMLTGWFDEQLKAMMISNDSLDMIELSLQHRLKEIQQNLKQFQISKRVNTGTTLTMLLCIDREYILVHVGDSVAYQMFEVNVLQKIWRLIISDKNVIKKNKMTYDDVDERGALTACLGMAGEDTPYIIRGRLRKNSIWIIGSDGIMTDTSINYLEKCFARFKRMNKDMIGEKLESLGRVAAKSGSRDNMAAVGVIIR